MARKVRVLVTGANGQLGRDVVNQLFMEDYEVYALGRKELDVTNDVQVQTIMEKLKPDIVIHTAAYTKVDQAESEPNEAFRVNSFGTRNIAVASEIIGAKLVYISTDYVFSGNKNESYNEYNDVSPINIYGKSKLIGEQLVRDFHSKFFIVRTSWVYGKNGNNFVKTMLQLAKEKQEISVVNDQIGSPTYTVDLAITILELIRTSRYGIYHISNSGSCSWYDFAKKIFELSKISIELKAIATENIKRPAKRPPYSVLAHHALKANGFSQMRSWETALESFLEEIKECN